MKSENSMRDAARRARPWEERDEMRQSDGDAGRQRRQAEEVEALNATLQSMKL
jgi:hypothetical protein